MTTENDKKHIQFGSNSDFDPTYIEDIVPDQLTQIYPYRALFGNPDKVMLEQNTTTICRISQSDLNPNEEVEVDKNGKATNKVDSFSNLTKDKNGNLYFEMIKSYSITNDLHSTKSTGKKTLESLKTIEGLVNNYVEIIENKPLFVTIGKPFNEEDYKNGKQQMFIVQKITPSKNPIEVRKEDEKFQLNKNKAYAELEMHNVSIFLESYTGCKIIFTTNLDITDNILNSDGSITLDVEKSMLLHSIKAKGNIIEQGLTFHEKLCKGENVRIIDGVPYGFTITSDSRNKKSWIEFFKIDETSSIAKIELTEITDFDNMKNIYNQSVQIVKHENNNLYWKFDIIWYNKENKKPEKKTFCLKNKEKIGSQIILFKDDIYTIKNDTEDIKSIYKNDTLYLKDIYESTESPLTGNYLKNDIILISSKNNLMFSRNMEEANYEYYYFNINKIINPIGNKLSPDKNYFHVDTHSPRKEMIYNSSWNNGNLSLMQIYWCTYYESLKWLEVIEYNFYADETSSKRNKWRKISHKNKFSDKEHNPIAGEEYIYKKNIVRTERNYVYYEKLEEKIIKGNIDFNAKETLTPIRMSLASDEDKVEMQADWLNSQTILPEFIAEEFKDGLSLCDAKADLSGKGTRTEEEIEFPIFDGLTEISKNRWFWQQGKSSHYVKLKTKTTMLYDIQIAFRNLSGKLINMDMYYTGYDYGVTPDGFLAIRFTTGLDVNSFEWADGLIHISYITKEDAGFILNMEDRHLLEDMLIITAGFTDSWSKAPLDEQGKIKDDFRVGHRGIKVKSIASSNPSEIIDGLYETHIREFSEFLQEKQRKNLFLSLLISLSRYIYSSHCISNGCNDFNQIYLPWYLELSDKSSKGGTNKIEYSRNEVEVLNRDANAAGASVKSYVLQGTTYHQNEELIPSTLAFKSKSHYFRKDFSNGSDLLPNNEFSLPENLDISNTILVETDRKLILPTLSDHIEPSDKINFPKDIKDIKDLKYLFFINVKEFKKLYIDTFKSKGTIPKGTIYNHQIIRRNLGIVWTEENVKKELERLYPKKDFDVLKFPKIINNYQEFNGIYYVYFDWGRFSWIYGLRAGGSLIYEMGQNYLPSPFGSSRGEFNRWVDKIGSTKTFIKEIICRNLGFNPKGMDILSNQDSSKHIKEDKKFNYRINYSTFTNAQLITKKDIKKSIYNYFERPFKFDKQSWKRFLNSIDINPLQNNEINLVQKNDFHIKDFEKIDIYYMWGDKIKIKVKGSKPLEIELNNVENEVITKQGIRFF